MKTTNETSVWRKLTVALLRKHFLWEVFLVDKLKIGWEEVHEIVKQLEHIQSSPLIQRLDYFLGTPAYSPHGKPIPNVQAEIIHKPSIVLTSTEAGDSGIIIAIKDGTSQFWQYPNKRNIYLGSKISVIEKLPFDQSMDISVGHLPKINISQQVRVLLPGNIARNDTTSTGALYRSNY